MPDVDLLPLNLRAGWRKVSNYLADRASVDEVAHATARALAQTLRKVGGAPGLPEIAETTRRWALAAEGELELGVSSGQVCVPRRDQVPTLIAEQVASTLIATGAPDLARATPEQALEVLAVHLVRELACHYGFDRIAVQLLRDPQQRPDELAARVDCVLQHPVLVTFAARLARRPSGAGLRAPRRRRSGQPLAHDTDLETLR